MIRLKLRAFLRYRPRILTLFVLFAIAALITAANLSPDFLYKGMLGHYVTFGWPLKWRVQGRGGLGGEIVYRELVAKRLAFNLTIWLVITSACGGACEYLLRRNRPRLRWSLRTMLALVGFAAACCAWLAAARDRANRQDPLIAAIDEQEGTVFLDRLGPEWLDLLGADRFRRHIVGVELPTKRNGELRGQVLHQLGQLSGLRYLDIEFDGLIPGAAAALSDMRELRSLRANFHLLGSTDDKRSTADELMTAIGRLNQLEHLALEGREFVCDGLGHLAGLSNLKSLSLRIDVFTDQVDAPVSAQSEIHGKPCLMARLPALPRLEFLDLTDTPIGDDDLLQLAALPRLKSLILEAHRVNEPGLAKLAPLEFLQDLTISKGLSAARLRSLRALGHLKVLRIDNRLMFDDEDKIVRLPLDHGTELFVLERKADGIRRALGALRQANPDIVVESMFLASNRRDKREPEFGDETWPDRGSRYLFEWPSDLPPWRWYERLPGTPLPWELP